MGRDFGETGSRIRMVAVIVKAFMAFLSHSVVPCHAIFEAFSETVLAGHECKPTVFSSNHAGILVRCRCPSKGSRPCTPGGHLWVGPCVHTVFGLGQSIVLLSSSCLKTVSD